MLDSIKQAAELTTLPIPVLQAMERRLSWLSTARPSQLPPSGQDWDIWLFQAGRGAGKTRSAAEWLWWEAWNDPNSYNHVVVRRSEDLEKVAFGGPSGLNSVIPNELIKHQTRSPHVIELINGSKILGFSATEPDVLRGPQSHRTWADELASWKRLDLTWDDGVLMSNRLRSIRNAGRPKIVISTTPRPLRLLKDLRAQSRIPGSGTYLTTGSTYENRSHLSSMAVDNLERRFKGTRREKQELLGMIVDDIPGALWSLDTIADKRVWDEPRTIARKCRELVVGVDPAASNTEHSDETGIVVAGRADDGRAFVLADRSGVYSPADWGREVVNLYDEFDADRVVVEVNNGGDMAIEVVTNAARTLAREGMRPTPYIEIKRVHASRGKMTRAEPISARYAQGFVSHVGEFVDLEDQMVGFTLDRPKGGSPDRVDALVWALSALLLKEAPNLAESDIESFVKLSSWTIT